MSGIFISYRRDDSRGTAGRLYDDLADRFDKTHVFRDIDAIGIGADYTVAIHDFISSCDAVVVVIGNQWLEITDDEGRRRLAEPGDLLTEEIATGLAAGKLVIPVLVEDAEMPPASKLPPALAPLARLNALRVSDDRWDYDVGRLVARLAEVLPAPTAAASPATPAPAPQPVRAGGRRRAAVVALAVVVIAGLVVAGVRFLGGDSDDGDAVPVTPVQVTTPLTVPSTTTTTLARVTTTTTSVRLGESSITLSRGSGPAGTSVTVSGRGFDAGETVEVMFHVTSMGSAVANASGAFTGVVIKVPVGSLKGFPYLITATGKRSAKSARAPFNVT
jgi:hypothetical protein